MFKLVEFNNNSFRSNMFSEQDICKWISIHSKQTNTSWCVNNKLSNSESSRYVCRKVYMCHHSGFNKVSIENNKKGRSKNTECKAQIDIRIKLNTKDTRKKDKYIRDGLPAIVIFVNEHNHNLDSAEALSFLRPTNEVRIIYENYFNDGLGISESISIHETKLELEYGINSEELADASINPKYRTVRHWYDTWKLNNLGSSTELSVLQKLEDKKTDYEKCGIIVRFNENPFAILVVTPIMQRAHQLAFCKDIAFADSTASCDTQSHSVTFMLTSCGIGAIPLGMFITKGQTVDDYKTAFSLLKDSVPNSFYGQGFPRHFIIDDSEAERQALKSIWPQSNILLCRFHVLQSVWRWLWDVKHNIKNEHRKLLFKLFQSILIAPDYNSAHNAYTTAIGKTNTINNSISDEIIPLKYEKWVKYMNNYWVRKELWCLAFRDATVHGNQTNNFSEVNVQIFKDIVLSRNKAYNAIALVDFICTGLEDNYLRRLRTFVNGRNDTARLLFEDQIKRAVNINKDSIEKLPNNIFKVPSGSDCGYYEVDVTHGFCTCSKGNLGAFCKHQAAVYHHFNRAMPNLLAITVDSRYMLAKLAFGENVPEIAFYKPLHLEKNNCQSSEETTEIVEDNVLSSPIRNTIVETDDHLDNHNIDQQSDEYVNQIQELIKTNFEKFKSNTSVSVLSKCLDRLKKVKSIATWESFLSTAGSTISLRHRSRATIHVQPTTISRRKPGVTRGSKRLLVGRPVKTDNNKRNVIKRKRNLAENVRKNVPNAKGH